MRHMCNSTCVFVCALILSTAAFAQNERPPARGELDLRVMRALPAVFKVHVHGDVRITIPEQVSVDRDELDEAYNAAVGAQEIPRDLSPADGKWLTLARDPGRFLKPSETLAEQEFTAVEYGSGSAFAVSREGILLTNRHVVELEDNDPLCIEAVENLAPPSCEQMLEDVLKHIGGLPENESIRPFIAGSLFEWYGQQCKKRAKFGRAEVSIALAEQGVQILKPELAFRLALSMTMQKFSLDTRQGIRLPVTVIARGEPGWETDVAILKLEPGASHDAVICLPLANTEKIVANRKIYSLGFPGFKYDEERMSAAELYQVNVEPGVVQFFDRGSTTLRERLKALSLDASAENQKLLIVSALIRPGSSGGPIVFEDGSVAGLNVCYRHVAERQLPGFAQSTTPFLTRLPQESSLDMGVPIAAAKQILFDNKISVDPGPTTLLWLDGLAQFEKGQFQAAAATFQTVAEQQVVTRITGKPYAPTSRETISIVSHYVQEMIDRCRQ